MSVFATATGVGSWPGILARPAAEVVVGELADALAYLVELPARGVGADMLGRAGALLVDLALDTVPRGYRIVPRPGAVTRRAISMLNEDMDALEEAWETAGLRGGGRVVKVQAPGPITLAAGVELSNGHRAIIDPGAVRDLAASLGEGVAAHRAELARRLDTPVVVQFDEPTLPAALEGRLTGVTSLAPVAALDEAVALGLLDTCVEAAGATWRCIAARRRCRGIFCSAVVSARCRWMSQHCAPRTWTASRRSSTRAARWCSASCPPAFPTAGLRPKRSPPTWSR